MRAGIAWGAAIVALTAVSAFADDEVHVAKGPLPADEGVTISGRVFVVGDFGEKPLKVALARRSPPSFEDVRIGGPPLPFTAKDDESFRFEGLVPGVYDLTVSGDGLATTVREVEAYADSVDATLHVPLADCGVRVHVSLGFAGDAGHTSVDISGPDRLERGAGKPTDGVVEFAHLASGHYWIRALFVDDANGVATPPNGFREGWAQVDLQPGTKDANVIVPDRADVRLTTRSARKGEFVEGVLTCRELPDWHEREPFRVSTDADGATVIAGMRSDGFGGHWQSPGADLRVLQLPRGTFTLAIDSLGFAPWEERVDIAGATKVDAVLTPLPGCYVTLGDSLSDPWICVDVRPAAGGRWTPLLVRDTRVIESDHDDPMTLRAFLAPGRYEVSATTSGCVTTAPQALDVTADRTTIELTFPKPEYGRLLNGRTISRSGELVRGVVLHAFLRDGDGWRALTAKQHVVSDGTFQLQGLAPGTYRLTYDAAGAFALGQFDVADADVQRDFIVSRRPDPSAETGAPEHVVKGSLPADEGFVVAGSVVGASDESVHLQLGRMETDPVCQHGCAWSWRTVDLKAGEKFRFVGVPPGQYQLWTDWKGGRRIEPFDVFADHQGHEFQLPTVKLSGRIRPAFAGTDKRMSIRFHAVDGKFDADIEAAPRAEFETPPLPPGRLAVEVWWIQEGDSCPWTQPRRWTYLDVAPGTKRFDFEFLAAADVKLSVRSAARAETFEGKILDADLPDAAEFQFGVQAQGDRTLGTCTLEPSVFGVALGEPRETVWFRNITPGTHRLRFVAHGFETLERTVDLAKGIVPLDVALTPTPGTFVVAEGPGRIFEVFVRPAEGGAWRGILFGDNRNVPTHTNPMRPRELLAPGKWQFMATTADLAPSKPSTIELGADHAELVIALDCVPGATLHGTLRTPSGVALEDTETYVFVRDGDAWRRLRAKAPLIDARGAFEIRGLAPGAYRIAYDEAGQHVAGEFDVADADVTREFVFARR